MKQYSFNFSINRSVFSDQDYKKLMEELAETRSKMNKYREQVKVYNALSRKKK